MAAEREFKIKITGDASGVTTAAKQTHESLKEVTDSTVKHGAAAVEAGEKSKVFAGHMGEVRKTIRELSAEFPVAGLALRAFVTPIGAAITGAILFLLVPLLAIIK